MSVQPVQSHSPDQVVTQGRRQPSSAEADGSHSSAFAPQDAVVVSDQARKLAAASQQDGEELQLDFRKLREMAFPGDATE
jgi:hypothetical protein